MSHKTEEMPTELIYIDKTVKSKKKNKTVDMSLYLQLQHEYNGMKTLVDELCGALEDMCSMPTIPETIIHDETDPAKKTLGWGIDYTRGEGFNVSKPKRKKLKGIHIHADPYERTFGIGLRFRDSDD